MIIAAGVEQDAQPAERARLRKQDVDRKPDDDRRQAEKGVGEHQDAGAPGKPAHREIAADRRADDEGDEARRQADLQRQENGRPKVGIAAADKSERECESLREILHLSCAAYRRAGRTIARP
jgi:hypothetical protein